MVHSLGQHQVERKSFILSENTPATLDHVLTRAALASLKEGKSYVELKKELGDADLPVLVTAVVSLRTLDFRKIEMVP